MYKSIIFDVGDTLIHYSPKAEEVITERLKQAGVCIDSANAKRIDRKIELCTAQQIYNELSGSERISDDAFDNLLDDLILDDEFVSGFRLSENRKELFRSTRYAFKQVKVVDEKVYKLLGHLQTEYSLGIVSNYSADLQEYLNMQKLSSYFSSVIISEVVGLEKPDKRIFELAARELSCSADECLYVGDHPFDVMGAVNAGMDVAWLKYKFHELPPFISQKPTYVLHDITELTSIL